MNFDHLFINNVVTAYEKVLFYHICFVSFFWDRYDCLCLVILYSLFVNAR